MCLGERAPVTEGVARDGAAPATTAGFTGATAPVTSGGFAVSVPQLLTYKQAATVLGVTERTIWTLVNRGSLPVVRFGRSVRIDPADLRAFIERSKQGGAA